MKETAAGTAQGTPLTNSQEAQKIKQTPNLISFQREIIFNLASLALHSFWGFCFVFVFLHRATLIYQLKLESPNLFSLLPYTLPPTLSEQ